MSAELVLVCISIQMMNFHYSYESCFCYPNQAALQAPSDDTTNAQTTEQETELQQNGRRKRKRGLPSRLKDAEDEFPDVPQSFDDEESYLKTLAEMGLPMDVPGFDQSSYQKHERNARPSLKRNCSGYTQNYFHFLLPSDPDIHSF